MDIWRLLWPSSNSMYFRGVCLLNLCLPELGHHEVFLEPALGLTIHKKILKFLIGFISFVVNNYLEWNVSCMIPAPQVFPPQSVEGAAEPVLVCFLILNCYKAKKPAISWTDTLYFYIQFTFIILHYFCKKKSPGTNVSLSDKINMQKNSLSIWVSVWVVWWDFLGFACVFLSFLMDSLDSILLDLESFSWSSVICKWKSKVWSKGVNNPLGHWG